MTLRLQFATPSARPKFSQNPNPNNLRTGFSTLRPLPQALVSASSAATDSGLRFREPLLDLDSLQALAGKPALGTAADLLLSYGLLPANAGRIFFMYPHLLTCNSAADPFSNDGDDEWRCSSLSRGGYGSEDRRCGYDDNRSGERPNDHCKNHP